ncbi:hypothetical protein BpHYR1_046730 [Brachionus plicatilis]|uniref:Uncharacterized protein n=1 Tax=Brachionus plicatilis TaxID=10195 RepID=A0A3M7Q8J3_BRAPC|nr:hypothetical protein BpHYR1_046730 [Brachionus plicatilis]
MIVLILKFDLKLQFASLHIRPSEELEKLIINVYYKKSLKNVWCTIFKSIQLYISLELDSWAVSSGLIPLFSPLIIRVFLIKNFLIRFPMFKSH